MTQNVDVQGNKPLRFATFILVLPVVAGLVFVWHLYPLLPDPLVLGPEKEEGLPLLLVLAAMFFILAVLPLMHAAITMDKTWKLLNEHPVYVDIFFILTAVFWFTLMLDFLLKSIGYGVRLMYLGAASVMAFSGFFSLLCSRPWVKEAVQRRAVDQETRTQRLKHMRLTSRAFAALAAFGCFGFIFPNCQTAFLLGVSIILLIALTPLKTLPENRSRENEKLKNNR